jgi:hypothetical protein
MYISRPPAAGRTWRVVARWQGDRIHSVRRTAGPHLDDITGRCGAPWVATHDRSRGVLPHLVCVGLFIAVTAFAYSRSLAFAAADLFAVRMIIPNVCELSVPHWRRMARSTAVRMTSEGTCRASRSPNRGKGRSQCQRR